MISTKQFRGIQNDFHQTGLRHCCCCCAYNPGATGKYILGNMDIYILQYTKAGRNCNSSIASGKTHMYVDNTRLEDQDNCSAGMGRKNTARRGDEKYLRHQKQQHFSKTGAGRGVRGENHQATIDPEDDDKIPNAFHVHAARDSYLSLLFSRLRERADTYYFSFDNA